MPSLPLPRFLETHQTKVEHARKLEQTVREAGGDLRETRSTSHTAADTISLRGIPAIGRGVAGVVFGTKPGSNLGRPLSRQPRPASDSLPSGTGRRPSVNLDTSSAPGLLALPPSSDRARNGTPATVLHSSSENLDLRSSRPGASVPPV